MNLILSIYFGYHDSCITFSDHEKILLHLEAERLFRVKHIQLTADQMQMLIGFGLDYLGIGINDIDTVLLSIWNSQFYYNGLEIRGKKFNPILTRHHQNHIGASYPAGFEDSFIICSDGGSEDGCTKLYYKKDNKVTLLEDLSDTILTGKFYGTITQMIINPDFHLAHENFPGKTMGLSALGTYSEEFHKLIDENRRAINFLYSQGGIERLNGIFGISDNYNQVWLDQRRCDLAHTAQKVWCDEFLEVISKYKDISKNISLVGGCALNVKLNRLIATSGWFKNVYVSPVSGDCGQSLGAILFRYPNIKCDYPYLGCGFGNLEETPDLVSQVTADLMENKIVAWYQDASEVGARALGHRSFLGLPNSPEMKRKLSEEVKGREPYRPVAAILTEEFLPEFTSEHVVSPFMTFAPSIKEKVKKDLPAITHFDGTCRIQVLKKKDNPVLHKILTQIGKLTGYPVLMNSSFNVAGEPIVYTVKEALNTFENTASEVLYVNGKRFAKTLKKYSKNIKVFLLLLISSHFLIDFLADSSNILLNLS